MCAAVVQMIPKCLPRKNVMFKILNKYIKLAAYNNYNNSLRSNEILGWGGVENRQLLCFFKA
jgi:hypothetical protein